MDNFQFIQFEDGKEAKVVLSFEGKILEEMTLSTTGYRYFINNSGHKSVNDNGIFFSLPSQAQTSLYVEYDGQKLGYVEAPRSTKAKA